MEPTHTVLREFEEGRPLKKGEHIDASALINTPMLEDHGYLRRLTPAERAAGSQQPVQAKRPSGAPGRRGRKKAGRRKR